jgi:hypothetical protein
MTCPQCHRPLHVQRQGMSPTMSLVLASAFNVRFHCPFCETRIGISSAYQRWTLLLIVLLTTAVACGIRTQSSSSTWLLAMLVVAFLLRMGGLAVFIPPLSIAPKGEGVPFAGCYLALVFIIFIEQFILFGWAIVLMGTRQDLYEHFAMLSYPLAWVNPNFLISPQRSFLDTCGVLLANSYFGAFALWFFANLAGAVFRRNRVTRMSISDTPPDPDD